jgi:hypothetical protein
MIINDLFNNKPILSESRNDIVNSLVNLRATVKQIQTGRAKYLEGFASQLEIALYDAITALRDSKEQGVQNTVNELAELRAIAKQVQSGKIAFPQGYTGHLEWVLYDAITQIENSSQGVTEVSLGDYRKKAAVSQAGAKINKFFGRDDPAKVAAADQTIAKREKGLGRADARAKAYTPPAAAPADLEKQQRDLTARYPNIDELVRRAELNRDPNYEYADGQAYYAARDAEQNYQKLKQIQRVIQGLNESLDRSHLP